MLQKLIIGLLLATHSIGFAQVKQSTNIGQQTFSFIDPSRHRLVKTEVWYPTADTLKKSDQYFSPFIRQFTVRNGQLPTRQLPLILFSHGTGGGRLTLEWLAQGLARKGFMVAAVDHYGNTFDNKIPLEFLKPWERPLDISFALTSLLQNESFKAVIDSSRIGALGFSFGGYTVIALAGAVTNFTTLLTYYKTNGRHELEIPELPGISTYVDDPTLAEAAKETPPLKDNRIKAFFSISPALGQGFTKSEQVKAIQAPIYIIGSQSDSIAPVVANARHFHKLIRGSRYYEFPGKTGHYVMLSEAIEELKKSDPIYFTDDKSVDRHQIHGQVIDLSVDFFRNKLKLR
ncbi:dienelactone hydrolase [Spirosoma sp. HMF4905]|uniref:Dienelactone hydrolase n=1 Tax=Spirosoma arboris TaxID=2682092 RepID=A0A7K1SJ40_9BACT|nr:dienelactone hydrolase [Spirosoma arboris]MVM33586.1 dienelactone hydrolase [Spirosoma arboris]